MSEIDHEARQRILELQDRISELQAMLLLTLSEMRALKEMSSRFWGPQQVKVPETDDIPTALDKLQEEHLDNLLASFTKENMDAARQLKKNTDKLRKK
jgi:hypothetical protein